MPFACCLGSSGEGPGQGGSHISEDGEWLGDVVSRRLIPQGAGISGLTSMGLVLGMWHPAHWNQLLLGEGPAAVRVKSCFQGDTGRNRKQMGRSK